MADHSLFGTAFNEIAQTLEAAYKAIGEGKIPDVLERIKTAKGTAERMADKFRTTPRRGDIVRRLRAPKDTGAFIVLHVENGAAMMIPDAPYGEDQVSLEPLYEIERVI